MPDRLKQAVIGGLVGIALLGVVVWLWRTPQPAAPVTIVQPSSPVAREMKVYVTGEVVHEGVYALKAGDRVEDALRAAGGTTAEADLDRVNLSARVKDEEHIRVPHRNPTPAGEPTVKGETGVDRLDLNTATMDQLDALPGIGPVTATRILQYREQNGFFTSVEQLQSLKLVNRSTFEKIKDLVIIR